jgi:hypothetical protein
VIIDSAMTIDRVYWSIVWAIIVLAVITLFAFRFASNTVAMWCAGITFLFSLPSTIVLMILGRQLDYKGKK